MLTDTVAVLTVETTIDQFDFAKIVVALKNLY